MKIINLFFLLSFFMSFSQVKMPQASPKSKIIQTVGLTEFTIEYSRPSIKGRKIMGDLVAYGEIWRTGANNITTISFNDEIIINDILIPEGSYSLLTKPNTKSWDIYFLKNIKNQSVLNIINNWNNEMVVVEINVPINHLDNKIETFTIDINDIKNDRANITLKWENTLIKIPVNVLSEKKVMASIKKTLKDSPSANDLYSAASYYLQEDKDLNKAKEWINKAVKIDSSKYWMYRQQSIILNKLNENNKAILAARKSLELAKKAGNKDYVRMNLNSINEWEKLISSN